jgi:ATP-binding cassette subfamily B protein
MIAHFAGRYPKQILFAAIALVVAASSTLAIPWGSRMIIDKGFIENGGEVAPYFQLLLGIVVVLGIATAFRFYFVSWLGERVVADVRIAVQQNLLRLGSALFRGKPSRRNRQPHDRRYRDHRTDCRHHCLGRTAQCLYRYWRFGLTVQPRPRADRDAAVWHSAGSPTHRLSGSAAGEGVAQQSGPRSGHWHDHFGITRALKIVQAFGQESREHRRFADAVDSTFAAAKKRIRLRAFLTALVMALVLWRDRHAGVGRR